jgi:hypothetical protein
VTVEEIEKDLLDSVDAFIRGPGRNITVSGHFKLTLLFTTRVSVQDIIQVCSTTYPDFVILNSTITQPHTWCTFLEIDGWVVSGANAQTKRKGFRYS